MGYYIDTSQVELDTRPATNVTLTEIQDLSTKQKWLRLFLLEVFENADEERDEHYSSDFRFFEAVQNGNSLGYMRLGVPSKSLDENYSGEVGCLSDAYVLPEYRHQGVFRDMIKLGVEDCNLKIVVNEESETKKHMEFYARLGFSFHYVFEGHGSWNQCWSCHESIEDVVAKKLGIPEIRSGRSAVDDDAISIKALQDMAYFGYNEIIECPNCSNETYLNVEKMPFIYSWIDCECCGFQLNPVVSYRSLDELNAERLESYKGGYTKEGCGKYEPESCQIKPDDFPPRLVKDFNDIFKVLEERRESQAQEGEIQEE